MRDVLRLVETYELPPLPLPAEPLRLRLEVFQRTDGSFVGKLYCHETYRIQASFGRDENGKRFTGDHELLVREEFLGVDDFEGGSADAVLRQLLAKIDQHFGVDG